MIKQTRSNQRKEIKIMTNKLYTKTTTIQEWYGNGLTIPPIDSKRFFPFATSCMGLVATLMEKKTEKTIRVGLSHLVDTAYADPDKSLIVISDKFLSGDFRAISVDKKLSANKTIGAILGVLVHEIGHFAYSPKDLSGSIAYVQSHTTKAFNRELAKRIANTLEDIYVEYRLSKVAPTIAWSLDEINKLMLTEEIYKDSIKSLKKITSVSNPPVNNAVLNFLLFAKITSDSGRVSPFVKNLFSLARSVIKLESVKDRYVLALRLYEIFAQEKSNSPLSTSKQSVMTKSDDQENIEEEDDQEEDDIEDYEDSEDDSEDLEDDTDNDQESDSGIEDDTDDQEYNSDSGDDSIESDDQEEEEETTGLDKGQSTEQIDLSDLPLEIPSIGAYESENAVEPYFNEVESDKISRHMGLDGHKIEESIMAQDKFSTMEMDKRYTKLSQVALQRASANLGYSNNQNRGRELRQINRIITDRKIFANRLPTDTLQPMEIIILLDCSGSMVQYNHNKLLPASMATLGAATGLISGRCIVSVYGHTADKLGAVKTVNIYALLKNGESPTTLAKRLAYLNHSQPCSYNRDGYALYEMSKKFSAQKRKKVILVISDGLPNGSDSSYDGFAAQAHTKQMVQSIRKSGIEVFSLSIDTEAYSGNNYIYGSENNVCNTDPNVIDTMIRDLFLK